MGIRIAEEAGHPGEWRRFTAGDEAFRLLIRPCSEALLEELRDKYRTRGGGIARFVGGTRRGRATAQRERELSKFSKRLAEYDRARAQFELVDSEDLEIEMATDVAAEAFSKLLGEPLKKGQAVKLDGRLSDAVKEKLLAVWPGGNLTAQINATADSIGSIAAQEDADEEETLSGN